MQAPNSGVSKFLRRIHKYLQDNFGIVREEISYDERIYVELDRKLDNIKRDPNVMHIIDEVKRRRIIECLEAGDRIRWLRFYAHLPYDNTCPNPANAYIYYKNPDGRHRDAPHRHSNR